MNIETTLYAKYPELRTKKWIDFNQNGEIDGNEELEDTDGNRAITPDECYEFIEDNKSYIDARVIDAAVKHQIINLKDVDKEIRATAASFLGELGKPRAVIPLIAALNDTDIDVRRAAAEALGELKDKKAVRPLVNALRDSEEMVRWTAMEALGKLGDPRAIGPLENISRIDLNPLVKLTAVAAIDKIKAAIKK